MKTYTIESKIVSIETTTVKATSKENAMKFAENNPYLRWEATNDDPVREFVSIME